MFNDIWEILVVPDNIYNPNVHDDQQLHVNPGVSEVGQDPPIGHVPEEDPDININMGHPCSSGQHI